ncbi:low affinity immunoglobulin epsilon Fc receptor-like [Mytilus trossulus]|uniref:low affinity immunoglobulin epsilon Fc receptor-like n=1 Tax=Mytilus trossulus TaxID=6551 RepID=UPI0030059175
MSISYNDGSKECKGVTIGYIVQPTSLGYSSVGWSYFLVLDERCPDVTGYVFSKAFNSCYKVHVYDTTLRYNNYSQICESEGGELMKIDTDEKQQHIVIFLDQYDISNWIYFQGTHLLSEPTWRYDDGSVISYFNWHPSQPDSTTSDTSEYLCMRKSDQYQWHNCWKAMVGAFICEIQLI